MELYAIRYGESLFPQKYIFHDMCNSNEQVELAWSFYLAKLGGKVILFDTGFRNMNTGKTWGVNFKPFEEELSSIINDLSNVDVVFITHGHFDHIENLDLCKNASIIISKDAYENAVKTEEIEIKRKLLQDDTIIVEDEYLYNNKFLFKVIGGHTEGSSVIYFTEGYNTYVITGDECYVSDNMMQKRPIGTTVDIEKNTCFLTNCHDKGMIPLTMHDVKIFESYERVSENIVRIL
jgi:glyoxylase-like metal-dependent hydrolase (beta-lactamase superfamily II)